MEAGGLFGSYPDTRRNCLTSPSPTLNLVTKLQNEAFQCKNRLAEVVDKKRIRYEARSQMSIP